MWIFRSSKLHQKKYLEKTWIFQPAKLRRKKGRGNDLDFSISKITSKKVRGNDVNFSISEITSKKYVKMTWKLIEIWSSTYQCNIDVESTWIRRGVPVERPLLIYTCLKPRRYHNLYLWYLLVAVAVICKNSKFERIHSSNCPFNIKKGHSSNGWLQFELRVNPMPFKKGITASASSKKHSTLGNTRSLLAAYWNNDGNTQIYGWLLNIIWFNCSLIK